jgi:hypothetical protein
MILGGGPTKLVVDIDTSKPIGVTSVLAGLQVVA